MKKLLALIITVVMVLSIAAVPSFASEVTQDEWLFKDAFLDQHIGEYEREEGYYYYSEEYYHHVDESDPDSELDWVLVNASSNGVAPWYVKGDMGDFVFYDYNECTPFSFCYAVYDVGNNYFNELTPDDFTIYEDLKEVCLELGIGQPVGDADFDDELSILDATYIQCVMAQLDEFNEDDDIKGFYALSGSLDYISDMNRDGERNIMDATAIQLKLASLDYLSSDLIVEDYKEEDYPRGLFKTYGRYSIEFEPLYNKASLFDEYEKNFTSDKFVAVIRSEAQYFDVFSEYSAEYDEEFFSENALIAAVTRVYDAKAVAQISDIGVEGETLTVALNIYTKRSNSDVPTASPMAPLYYSFAAVDKELIKYVKDIKYTMPWTNGMIWNDKSETTEHIFTDEIQFEREELGKNRYFYYDNYRQDFIAIIDEFNDYYGITEWYIYSKDFFETKAVIMNISAHDVYDNSSYIERMEVKDNVLYVYENQYAIDGPTMLTIPAICHDFCIVDKVDIAGVTEIVLVK